MGISYPVLAISPLYAQDAPDSTGKVARIVVSIEKQELYTLNHQGDTLNTYPCSTSKYGTGNRQNSNKTPLGIHRIAANAARENLWEPSSKPRYTPGNRPKSSNRPSRPDRTT